MNSLRAILSGLALVAVAHAAPVRAQDLNEESFLEVRRQPFRLQWVYSLALEGPWLAAGGTNTEGFSALALYRREGASWISEPLPVGVGGEVDLDGNRLAVADSENLQTVVYRLESGQWTFESYMPANWASLQGNRVITSRNDFSGPFDVNVWRLGPDGFESETVLVPDAPQEYHTCCRFMTVWGKTAAFLARGVSGETGVHVYARERGSWSKQAELLPSNIGTGDLGYLALWGRTLVALYYESAGATAVVWEREGGTWHESARLAPGGSLWSLALQGDTLALGHDPSVGVVSVYQRSQGSWFPRATLAASNGQALGPAVALDGRTVVTTTHGIEARRNRVYVFRLPAL